MTRITIFGLFVAGLIGCVDSRPPDQTLSVQTEKTTLSDPLATSGHRASDRTAPLDDDQKPTDETITEGIRQRLMDTKMATNVQSVNIVTNDGYVTLRGVVKTLEEKQQVESVASDAVGTDKVYSKLEVE